MGIARALARVKRQAKRGALGALRTGLGEELRSGSIPAPLRKAARTIAALLDPKSLSRASRRPGSTATPASDRTPHDNLRASPPEHANKVGSDRGEDPRATPIEPLEETRVDPVSVGATPVYDATPVEAAPVDATPSIADPVDATPLTLDVTELAVAQDVPTKVATPIELDPEPRQAAAVSEAPAAPKKASAAKKPPATKKAATKSVPPAAKEKLAASKEEAKSPARSGPQATKKGTGSKGGKTSKKK